MNCAHCGKPILPGKPSLPSDLYEGARMHPPCLVRSEAGEQPPSVDNPSYGLFQLLEGRAGRLTTLQQRQQDQARDRLERMAGDGGE